jgi:hypothetical protein
MDFFFVRENPFNWLPSLAIVLYLEAIFCHGTPKSNPRSPGQVLKLSIKLSPMLLLNYNGFNICCTN